MSYRLICNNHRKELDVVQELEYCPFCDKKLTNIGFALLCQWNYVSIKELSVNQ